MQQRRTIEGMSVKLSIDSLCNSAHFCVAQVCRGHQPTEPNTLRGRCVWRSGNLYIGTGQTVCLNNPGVSVVLIEVATPASIIIRRPRGRTHNGPAATEEKKKSAASGLQRIQALGVDVEFAHQNITGNGGAGFAANPGSSSLEREATGEQHAAAGASSTVVTERAAGTVEATGCSVERQGQAKPAEQQLVAGRRGSENPGKGRRVKRCTKVTGDAIVDSRGGGPLPSSSNVDRLVRVRSNNERAPTVPRAAAADVGAPQRGLPLPLPPCWVCRFQHRAHQFVQVPLNRRSPMTHQPAPSVAWFFAKAWCKPRPPHYRRQ